MVTESAGPIEQQRDAFVDRMLRPPMLRAYAQATGFRDIEILPSENFFFQFYRLVP